MQSFINMLRNQWLLLALAAAFGLVWAGSDLLSLEVKRLIYSLSLVVKNLIVLVIPLLIIIFIANSLAAISNRAFLVIASLFSLIFLSNLLASLYTYAFYSTLVTGLSTAHQSFTLPAGQALESLWKSPEIRFIKNDTALLIGLLLGIYASYQQNKQINAMLQSLQALAHKFLKHIILPLLPLFVLGSLIKLKHEERFDYIVSTYDRVFLYFFAAQCLYILAIYVVAAGFRYKKCASYLKNIFPAYITGLTTLSSAVTMPVTLEATVKNTQDSKIAHTVIPATVNIHLLGTAIGTNILVLSTFAIFGLPMPDFSAYLSYAFYFAIAQFAVVGVSGGSVFATMPIIEAHLGASPEMLALISTMVIMFDPIDTSFNIAGNGGFAIIIKKLISPWQRMRSCLSRQKV
jgi:Na+/H+-dicarboxylate symporter